MASVTSKESRRRATSRPRASAISVGRSNTTSTARHPTVSLTAALGDGGTILLDEIGKLPVELQAKLLRVLQEELERLWGTQTLKVKVCVVAATNQDIPVLVRRAR